MKQLSDPELDIKVECECGFSYEANWQREYGVSGQDSCLAREVGALPVRTNESKEDGVK
jgi:hypothetical protein